MLELLAPAGNLDAVIAAVQNGADAVYMGFGDGFNARRSADNFTRESFAKAVRYCHIRGCKVYVTLNTLVGDRETPPPRSRSRRRTPGRTRSLCRIWASRACCAPPCRTFRCTPARR